MQSFFGCGIIVNQINLYKANLLLHYYYIYYYYYTLLLWKTTKDVPTGNQGWFQPALVTKSTLKVKASKTQKAQHTPTVLSGHYIDQQSTYWTDMCFCGFMSS